MNGQQNIKKLMQFLCMYKDEKFFWLLKLHARGFVLLGGVCSNDLAFIHLKPLYFTSNSLVSSPTRKNTAAPSLAKKVYQVS